MNNNSNLLKLKVLKLYILCLDRAATSFISFHNLLRGHSKFQQQKGFVSLSTESVHYFDKILPVSC